MKKNKGITLIALVVTIVILIILATISINLVLNSGLINRSEKGAELTEVAKVEERANIIYADKIIERYENKSKESVKLEEVIEELKNEGYKFERAKGDKTVDIKLDKEEINMVSNSTEKIQVSYVEGEDTWNYYVIIKGKYYRIYLDKSGVRVSAVDTKVENLEEKLSLSVVANSDAISAEVEGNTINITSTNKMGEVKLEVKYGSISKICTVNVSVALSEVENVVPGTYFYYPTTDGREILCSVLNLLSPEDGVELVACEPFCQATVRRKLLPHKG